MHEKTILKLLSHTIGQIIDQTVRQEWSVDQKNELSAHLADAAWNGLILMIRNCLANNQPAIIEEFGRFEHTNDGWSFQPAASLLEGATLKMPSMEGHQLLAHQALFYLQETLDIVKKIPEDVKLHTEEKTEQAEEILIPLCSLGEEPKALFLSGRLRRMQVLLLMQALRLSDGPQPIKRPSETIAYVQAVEAFKRALEMDPNQAKKTTPLLYPENL